VKHKTRLLGIPLLFLTLGIIIGALFVLNWQLLHPITVLSHVLSRKTNEPTPTPSLIGACRMQELPEIGLSFCRPAAWQIKLSDGPKNIQLGRVVVQSPDYDALVDQTLDGLPTLSIRHGYQLSILATRLTASSNINSMSDLKDFWKVNRIGHSISRQEERLVGGVPALYHVLSSPKEGNQIDTHILKYPLLFDINFYYNGTDQPGGEDFYRSLLDTFSFRPVDALIATTEDLTVTTVEVPASPKTASGKDLLITVKTNHLPIASQTELPTLVRQLPGGTALVIGTALPESTESILTQTDTFTFTWKMPDPGTANIVAEIIKTDGRIYESPPLSVTIGGSPLPQKAATDSAAVPGKYP
jgi:hypothetical protein